MMRQVLTIAPLGPVGAGLLSALHAAAFTEGWSERVFETLLSSPGARGLLASINAAPVGFALVRTGGSEAELLTLGVAPNARRAGAGRLLLADAMAAARDDGAEAMFLDVAVDNHPARALYRAFGFEDVGRRPLYYNGRTDAVICRLELRPVDRPTA